MGRVLFPYQKLKKSNAFSFETRGGKEVAEPLLDSIQLTKGTQKPGKEPMFQELGLGGQH